MAITSLRFAAFVLLLLILYHALRRRPQNVLLLIASYVFYATWSWWYLAILLAMTAANYLLALNLRRDDHPRRGVLWLGLTLNLVALGVLKYEDFFVPDLQAALNRWGTTTGIGGIEVLLPVGMSFYVVGVLSYLLDVYHGLMPPATDAVDFALYMAYFPKLLSGPIERARDFLPKLAVRRLVDNETLTRSSTLIVIGLVRKVVLADTLFLMRPADAFTNPEKYGGPRLASYLVVYGFALYNDFAGYTSLVRGISGLFGIELSANFNLPYFSRNISEFWARWHITLSQWLRDYIYYPVSRTLLRRNPSRYNVPNILASPMLAMLASGLWHGTGWPLVLWGALHGLYLVGERLLALWRPAGPPQHQPRWRQGFAMLVVFGLVTLAWVPFAMPDLSHVFHYWHAMLRWSHSLRPSVRILVILVPALWMDWVQYHSHDEVVFLRWPRLVQATLLAMAFVTIFLFSRTEGAPFVYQGF